MLQSSVCCHFPLIPQEQKDTQNLALRLLVQHIHKQGNEKRVDALCSALESLVESSSVEAKYVLIFKSFNFYNIFLNKYSWQDYALSKWQWFGSNLWKKKIFVLVYTKDKGHTPLTVLIFTLFIHLQNIHSTLSLYTRGNIFLNLTWVWKKS